MPGYSANTCEIITIFPLGVNCNSVNATTPLTTDGSISLQITGGTPPYSTQWSNGQIGPLLLNAQSGVYTAVTTDNYLDFTAVTVCQINTNSYFVEKFTDCQNPSNIIYYSANTSSPILSNNIYTISGQQGCWNSNGIQLFSAGTGTFFEQNVTLTSPPFSSCTECLPVIPPIGNVSGMCFNSQYIQAPSTTPTVNQILFLSAGTINTYPSWTSGTKTVYYNTTSSKWMISGWTNPGIPSLSSTNSPPIGFWAYDGVNGSASMTSGPCSANFIISTNKTNPTCGISLNGSILVSSVQGGTPPYTYSLNNVTYQPSNTFNNLDDGTYTIYVKDSQGIIGNKIETLTPQSGITNYEINVNFIPSIPAPTNTQNSTEVSFQYEVSVSPTLPNNKTVNFQILHQTLMSAGTATNGSPTLTYSTTTGTTGGGQILSAPIVPPTTSNLTNVSCHPNFYTSAITRIYNCKITGTGTIKGTIYKKVQTVTGNQCNTTGTIRDNVSVSNVSFVNPSPCEPLGIGSTNLSNTIQKTSLTTVSVPQTPFLGGSSTWNISTNNFTTSGQSCSNPSTAGVLYSTGAFITVGTILYTNSSFSTVYGGTGNSGTRWIKLDKNGAGTLVYSAKINTSGQVTAVSVCP
jgi:hypothetical protein